MFAKVYCSKFYSLLSTFLIILVVSVAGFYSSNASAFCGMFVAGAGAKLYNNASQVIISRVKNKTTITMENDFKGDAEKFALIVPVPVVLKEKDVKTVRAELFSRLDKFSAPRLVEYFEEDPCQQRIMMESAMMQKRMRVGSGKRKFKKKRDLGVTVEAEFDVEEYQIVVLSATESSGLETWLKQNGYTLPEGAAEILAPYIKNQMKFFAAKVDTTKAKKDESGKVLLSPLQFAMESPTFELPIRLGMINSGGLQDLIIYALTERQRVVVVNYPNIFIPTDIELGDKLDGEFGDYYLNLFNQSQDQAGGAAVLTEYAWNTSSCDPCPAPPLRPDEMRTLGLPSGRGVITRLHARYSNKYFKDDFVLALTRHDRNFQGRYIMRHPWKGEIKCSNPVRGRWGYGTPKAMGGSLGGFKKSLK